MAKRDPVCAHRWLAPRHDVPDSLHVNHVCLRPLNHEGIHACVCGAETSER